MRFLLFVLFVIWLVLFQCCDHSAATRVSIEVELDSADDLLHSDYHPIEPLFDDYSPSESERAADPAPSQPMHDASMDELLNQLTDQHIESEAEVNAAGDDSDRPCVPDLDKHFAKFTDVYKKHYRTPEEAQMRKQIFAKNLCRYVRHNAAALKAVKDATAGHHDPNDMPFRNTIYFFADFTPSEMRSYYPTVKRAQGRSLADLRSHWSTKGLSPEKPEGVDWSSLMPPIKSQSPCGNCWVHAALAAIEGRYAVATGKTISLSRQQISDCMKQFVVNAGEYANKGCSSGGNDYEVYWFLQNPEYPLNSNYSLRTGDYSLKKRQPFRVATEEAYPYMDGTFGKLARPHPKAKIGMMLPCHEAPKKPSNLPEFVVEGFRLVPPTEAHIIDAVNRGPVSFSIQMPSPGDPMYDYASGVFRANTTLCPPLDRMVHQDWASGAGHLMAIVGYGVDKQTGLKYWKIRNSWGDDWGDKGHMLWVRGENNCLIETFVAEPKLRILNPREDRKIRWFTGSPKSVSPFDRSPIKMSLTEAEIEEAKKMSETAKAPKKLAPNMVNP